MGGSERYVYNLSKEQSKEHDVHIFTTTRHLDRVGTNEDGGISIHRFYAPKVVWNMNPLTLMLRPLVNSESDVYHIHSYLYFSSNQAVIARLLKKRKALLQIHGGVGIPPYDLGWFKLAAKHFYDCSLGKFTIENSDIIASVSKSDLWAIATRYKIHENRLRYVPNMVDTKLFTPELKDPLERRLLLYLGDLEPWKGVGSLIKWIRAMNHSFSEEVTIRFVGQGSYMQYLLNLREKLRKSRNGISIEVMGPRNHIDVPSILRSSSALILPSYWEGMPTVVLEAMASGVPVISTKVGDIPQLIRDKETGLLINRSLESFKSAVSLVLNDRLLVSRMTKRARTIVEDEYTVRNVHRIVRNVYTEMVS
ncbi:MAG: hypothetical protein DRP09_03145 [Candidatus Thorarchaeota archaeon]|nr:MAG: hypothetical protein DRP09_03145 [Candidatus Thorarchaeota archaeon]